MTWKSHCFANGALTFALTGRLEIAMAAIATATLPDQMECLLPLGKHRGATHWVILWALVLAAAPALALHEVFSCLPALRHSRWFWHELEPMLRAVLFGFALGPLLHVLLDGCSSAGVPVAPFLRQRLQLCLYRTRRRGAWPWEISEQVFIACLLLLCILRWRWT